MAFTAKPLTELPPSAKRGGKQAVRPELEAWVKSLKPNSGLNVLVEDGNDALPFPRSTTLRQIVGEMNLASTHTVLTRPAKDAQGNPVKDRYFVIVNVTEAPKTNGPKP